MIQSALRTERDAEAYELWSSWCCLPGPRPSDSGAL